MKKNAKEVVAELAAGQWGMFTTAQAQVAGVSRTQIKRMVDSGFIEEMRRGVYRQAVGVEVPWAQMKAAWLSANPGKTAYERLGAAVPDAVIGGQAAACIHGAGELWESPYTLVVSTRRQTRNSDVKYLRRELVEGDVVSMDGLPVASIEETVAELVALRFDPSHVSGFARDVAALGKAVDEGVLAGKLAPLACRNGYANGRAFARAVLSSGYDQVRADQALRLAKEVAATRDERALEDIRKVVGWHGFKDRASNGDGGEGSGEILAH